MASTSDIRDIMNLGQAGPPAAKNKKKRQGEPQVRMTGVAREVQALMGDSVPPIAIIEQRSYKSRPKIQKAFKVRHWEERDFMHGARKDGLVLRHWKRAIPGAVVRPTALTETVTSSNDIEMGDDKPVPAVQEVKFEEEFPAEKWDVSVELPTYTDEQYDSLLKSEDWTKQETDYLMGLCRDYDLRWLLIADRYTIKEIPLPSGQTIGETTNGDEVVSKPQYPSRSMEQLKSRYYAIAAKMLETQTPASNMTQSEFKLWETMRNFDVKTETMRKSMAEKLFERTKDEADEERILLEELHRITKNEKDFFDARSELYARLESVTPIRRTERGEEQSTAMYQTSAGLSMLLQQLLARERKVKRAPLPGSAEAATQQNPTPTETQKSRASMSQSRRDTMDTNADESGSHKKGSMSQPTVRKLTAAEEARFGVSHPQERITSGVHFRHEKINRLTMAKSQTQTTKIQAALTELGIPPRLLMPTERVCREFERLVTEINLLVDARKVSEKVASEIKVLEEARRLRLGLNEEGEQGVASTADAMDVDSSQVVDQSTIEHTQVESHLTIRADMDQGAENDDRQHQRREREEDDNDEEEETRNGDSTMQIEDSRVEDEDDEEDEDEGGAGRSRNAVDEDEDEDREEDDDDEDNAAAEAADSDNDNEDDDEGPQLGLDNSDEDDDGEEAEEEEEVIATPQLGSDDDDDDDEEEEAGEEEEQEEEEEENNNSDEGEPEPKAEAEDSDAAEADGDEDAPEPYDETPASAANIGGGRAHKRSASVISEASRAGSNRSGLGRKKRR